MNAWRLVHRHVVAHRRSPVVFATGVLEPVFYLLSIGVGVGALIGQFQVDGRTIPYAQFVAPALLAVSAMTGAVIDATYNFFFRLRYDKLYDTVLATPMTATDVAVGETLWSLIRGGIYAAVFLVVMAVLGLVQSWWGVLVVPAALLVGFACGAVAMTLTSYMTTWQHFAYVDLALIPLTLFSGTFFPVDALGAGGRAVVEVTPLYRGVVLCRELTVGELSRASVISVAYLAAMGLVGTWAARRRLDGLLRA